MENMTSETDDISIGKVNMFQNLGLKKTQEMVKCQVRVELNKIEPEGQYQNTKKFSLWDYSPNGWKVYYNNEELNFSKCSYGCLIDILCSVRAEVKEKIELKKKEMLELEKLLNE